MTVPDGGRPPAGDDVLEMGRRRGPVLRWRPPMAALVLAAVALLAGLAAGYAAGVRHAGKPPAVNDGVVCVTAGRGGGEGGFAPCRTPTA